MMVITMILTRLTAKSSVVKGQERGSLKGIETAPFYGCSTLAVNEFQRWKRWILQRMTAFPSYRLRASTTDGLLEFHLRSLRMKGPPR